MKIGAYVPSCLHLLYNFSNSNAYKEVVGKWGLLFKKL